MCRYRRPARCKRRPQADQLLSLAQFSVRGCVNNQRARGSVLLRGARVQCGGGFVLQWCVSRVRDELLGEIEDREVHERVVNALVQECLSQHLGEGEGGREGHTLSAARHTQDTWGTQPCRAVEKCGDERQRGCLGRWVAFRLKAETAGCKSKESLSRGLGWRAQRSTFIMPRGSLIFCAIGLAAKDAAEGNMRPNTGTYRAYLQSVASACEATEARRARGASLLTNVGG